MPARYVIVDVFAAEPLAGNALAVFPDPGSVEPERMQRVAREMNLSETTFVTEVGADSYTVRIFTPADELPFAGHPTLGTAWTLRHLSALSGDQVTQRSAAGETPVRFESDRVWLERGGDGGEDHEDIDATLGAFDIDETYVGFDGAEIGDRSIALRPAIADAGVPVLMLPLINAASVAALKAPSSLGDVEGVYCFAPLGPGRLKARFFAPGIGISEDPATGAAAAALGLYLGARVGSLDVEIEQGAEIARPSFISLRAAPGLATVGGQVHQASEGKLLA
jgi:trans-2,3-dihydro-3-hydroxyanthranilate isomerase